MDRGLCRRDLIKLSAPFATVAVSGCLNRDPEDEETQDAEEELREPEKYGEHSYELEEVVEMMDAHLERVSTGDDVVSDVTSMSSVRGAGVRAMDDDVVEDVEHSIGWFPPEAEEDAMHPVFWVYVENHRSEPVEFELSDLPPYQTAASNESGVGVGFVPTENHDLVADPPGMDGLSLGDWLPGSFVVPAEYWVLCEYAVVSEDGWPEGAFEFDGMSLWTWDASTPGPTEASRFEDRGSVDGFSLYHEADGSTEVYYEPGRESVESGDVVEFSFVNRGGDVVVGRRGDRTLYKVVEGDLYRVAFSTLGEGQLLGFPPGHHSFENTLALYEDESGEAADYDVGYLGGGTYLHTSGKTLGEDGDEVAALVEFEAPEVSLEPFEEAQVNVEDDTAWVEVPADDSAEFTVTEVDEHGEDGEHVITEQLYSAHDHMAPDYSALRAAIPYFDEEVSQVEVEIDEDAVWELFALSPDHERYHEDEGVIVYEGQGYRVER